MIEEIYFNFEKIFLYKKFNITYELRRKNSRRRNGPKMDKL